MVDDISHLADIVVLFFSFNEMAKYDLPAFVDYILKYTNTSKLNYIGHSQGILNLDKTNQ